MTATRANLNMRLDTKNVLASQSVIRPGPGPRAAAETRSSHSACEPVSKFNFKFRAGCQCAIVTRQSKAQRVTGSPFRTRDREQRGAHSHGNPNRPAGGGKLKSSGSKSETGPGSRHCVLAQRRAGWGQVGGHRPGAIYMQKNRNLVVI